MDENDFRKFLIEEKALVESTGTMDEICDFYRKYGRYFPVKKRKRLSLDEIIDKINARYGKTVIWKGDKHAES